MTLDGTGDGFGEWIPQSYGDGRALPNTWIHEFIAFSPSNVPNFSFAITNHPALYGESAFYSEPWRESPHPYFFLDTD